MTTVDNTNKLVPGKGGSGGTRGANPRSLFARWLTWKDANDAQSYQGHKADSDPAVRERRAGGTGGGAGKGGVGLTGQGNIGGLASFSGLDLFFHMESTRGVHTSGQGYGAPDAHTDGNLVSGWRGVTNQAISPAGGPTNGYEQGFFSSIAGTTDTATNPRYVASAYTFLTPSGHEVHKPAIAWFRREDASCGLEHIAYPQVSATRGFTASDGWCAVFVYQPSASPGQLTAGLDSRKLSHVFLGNVASGTNRYFMIEHSRFESSGFTLAKSPSIFHGIEEEVNLTATNNWTASGGTAPSFNVASSFGSYIRGGTDSGIGTQDSSSHPNIVAYNIDSPWRVGGSSMAYVEILKVDTSTATGFPSIKRNKYSGEGVGRALSGYSGPSTNPFFGAQDAALLSLGWSPSNYGTTFTQLGAEGNAGIRHTLSGIYMYEVLIFKKYLDRSSIDAVLQTLAGKYGLI